MESTANLWRGIRIVTIEKTLRMNEIKNPGRHIKKQ